MSSPTDHPTLDCPKHGPQRFGCLECVLARLKPGMDGTADVMKQLTTALSTILERHAAIHAELRKRCIWTHGEGGGQCTCCSGQWDLPSPGEPLVEMHIGDCLAAPLKDHT